MTDEPKTLEEASALFDSLLAQENAILGENSALWEKVFMAANKDMIMIEDGKTTASSCWIPSRTPRISSPRRS